VQELHDLFRTGGYDRWNEVRPEWPDRSIGFYFPGTDSGTFDYFVEAIIEGVDEDATHRGDGTASEDDNVLALAVESDPNAIGYFGFAFYQEAGQALKAVAIDGGDGCVEPSFEAARDGTYTPLSRPLYIYTREKFLRERPEIREFVRFYLEHSDELVREVGYVTIPDETLQEQIATLEAIPTATPEDDE
jgi:phosphate transport system substrate-binding protein